MFWGVELSKIIASALDNPMLGAWNRMQYAVLECAASTFFAEITLHSLTTALSSRGSTKTPERAHPGEALDISACPGSLA